MVRDGAPGCVIRAVRLRFAVFGAVDGQVLVLSTRRVVQDRCQLLTRRKCSSNRDRFVFEPAEALASGVAGQIVEAGEFREVRRTAARKV